MFDIVPACCKQMCVDPTLETLRSCDHEPERWAQRDTVSSGNQIGVRRERTSETQRRRKCESMRQTRTHACTHTRGDLRSLAVKQRWQTLAAAVTQVKWPCSCHAITAVRTHTHTGRPRPLLPVLFSSLTIVLPSPSLQPHHLIEAMNAFISFSF